MSKSELQFKDTITLNDMPSAYFEDVIHRLISGFQQPVTADYQTTGNHDWEVVICNNTSDITITLHPLIEGDKVSVIRANTGAVTIDGNGFTIIGESTQAIALQYDAPLLVASKTEWLCT